ncbi:DUF1415 domain-containing protein [Thiomicrorhabdus sp. zzn3]|uniref:DUF1415 domain-containing protein n=1 Tax=Thiomicrorhabdus sp. zzn3 TaxID=3039775 RepID=UPI002436D146|nr:DUF1415 domain-containing protein [Thiomicrorhabdus sp. zzn3]MDG6777543.1 DUF1415 domain-containing protein [Thiomicrorhabdus sp. zzn3]
MTDSASQIEQACRNWLEQVVIGLNLCPFASKPYLDNQVRIVVSDCEDETCLLEQLQTELTWLADHAPKEIETTLIALPYMLGDFYDYNDFLDLAEGLLETQGWSGHFQLASFHPHYQFAGTQPDDCENLTNRAPYPILHLIREASLEQVLQHYPNPEQIPERNIETVCGLADTQLRALFPYLFR